MTNISIQKQDFDPGEEYSLLRSEAGDAGGIVSFTGLVRELYDESSAKNGKVESLFLEHYPGMTEKCLKEICEEAEARWPLLSVRVIHRVGELLPGDQIVFVGTASAHRQAAFDSARFIMDYLKSKAPFWKKQKSTDSSDWVESRDIDETALEQWQ
jgi:molybdopterin synthase catalytic subunit